jgi:Ribbon-helix-helix protein, copG family
MTRGRGRPSTGTAVHLRIDPVDLAIIDAEADDSGTTRAELVRAIIRSWVEVVTNGETVMP